MKFSPEQADHIAAILADVEAALFALAFSATQNLQAREDVRRRGGAALKSLGGLLTLGAGYVNRSGIERLCIHA